MNIGIDARLLERRMTGIGRFLSIILKDLPELDNQNKYFLFTYNKLNQVHPYYTNIPTGAVLLHEKLYAPYWTNLVLPEYLRQNKIDIYFSVNKILPFKRIEGVKYVSVIHDVFYKIDKSFHSVFYRKYLDVILSHSLKASDSVITVSEKSKEDIIKLFNIPDSKVKVVYEAADDSFSPLNLSDEEKVLLRNRYGLPDKFVLYVGVIENRKNIQGILKIADMVYENNKEIKFLLVGRPGFGSEILIKEIEKRENIVYLKYVEDSTLKKLYSISRAFLFPSFYEGFGLPPLEAMQSGVPVLASNTSSIPEVVNGGGILHYPTDYTAFYKDLMKLIEDDGYYLEWRDRGINRAKNFSTSKTTKDIIEVFSSV